MIKGNRIVPDISLPNNPYTDILEDDDDGDDLKELRIWEEFKRRLPGKECRYVLYNFVSNTMDTAEDELVYLVWKPDGAPDEMKELYSANDDNFAKKLNLGPKQPVGSLIDFQYPSYENEIFKL